MKEEKKMNGIYKKMEEEVLSGIEKRDIRAIETEIKQFQSASFEARARSVIILQYLFSTGRYQENPFYKNVTFDHYIETEFGITDRAFRDYRFALTHHYADAKEYGIGTIAKIREKCGGVAKVAKVLEKIHAEAEKRKTPITSTTVREIIRNNMIPKPEAPDKPPERYYKQELETLQASKKETAEELTTLRDQVARQKETILRLKTRNEILLAENARLKDEIRMILQNVRKADDIVGPVMNPSEVLLQA